MSLHANPKQLRHKLQQRIEELEGKTDMIEHVKDTMEGYELYKQDLNDFNKNQVPKYFHFDNAVEIIFDG